MSLIDSHVWERMKLGSNTEQECHVCKQIIPFRTPRTWIYRSTYRVEYAHPSCKK